MHSHEVRSGLTLGSLIRTLGLEFDGVENITTWTELSRAGHSMEWTWAGSVTTLRAVNRFYAGASDDERCIHLTRQIYFTNLQTIIRVTYTTVMNSLT